jgi:hypothetical protein
MNKCDWCHCAGPERDKHGNLKCRFSICQLTQKEILEILKNIPKELTKK